MTRLGLADRVEVARKYVRLHPYDEAEPIDAAVRVYDPDEGAHYPDEIHESVADEIDAGEPIVISDALETRLRAEYETVEFGIRACDPSDDDCRHATLVRDDFNEIETGDIVDVAYRTSGAELVSIHERRH